MSHPAVPPSPEDPTASLGSNRDGRTRSFEPPPPVDPYLPSAPPPAYAPPPAAYQPPPAYAPPVPAYSPPPPMPPAYPAPGGYAPGYPPVVMAAGPPTSGWSVAALVLGIVGIFFGWCALGLPCLLAVIFGHVGLNETRRGAKSGKGLAVAGLVMGYLCLVPTVVITLWIIVTGAADTAR